MRPPRTTCLGRFWRGRRPDRNPLRRAADRAETAILAILVAVFCAGAPLAGHAAASWMRSLSLEEIRAQQSSIHRVTATLLDAPVDMVTYSASSGLQADVGWTAPDGRKVTGLVAVAADAKAGSTVQIWTDTAGHLVSPLQRTQIAGRADLAAGAAVGGLGTVVLLTGLACRGALNRRRMTAWDADWMTTEPRWTSRR